MNKEDYWKSIREIDEEFLKLIGSYWSRYSDFGNWEFWVTLLLLIAPLILLFFTVDKKRILEVFFFGYSVNFLWSFVDMALSRYNFLAHKYFVTPLFPYALSITTSLLPVGFLLVYQYSINNNKNFYLNAILLSAIFAFGFASLEIYLDFLDLRKGMNLIHIFLLDIVISFIAYWMTKFVLKVSKKG
ncbi:hypothetical protein [Metabacillus endolithicus]|uniref:Uncharacterized protein n=1 Tax=Metabacillus endolithicus TaxID=1535204 RepID=A0ABW5C1P0_9BACI|nr:hypothetical protein [Metabacillus endolithicus]UPG66051.1 hypothetical protein MVE64_26785 [Metabacillus endolithicus]